MSRSNPQANIVHPCTRWLEWWGKDGVVGYYDKKSTAADKNVPCKFPFHFIYLDSLNCVTGYNKKAKSGVVSNQVRDVTTEIMAVKLSNNMPVASGVYSRIKDTITANGGKFCKAVYIAYKSEKGLEIGCIRMAGSALGPWFDFYDKNREEIEKTHCVKISGRVKGESDAMDFYIPVFELVPLSSATAAEATELDKRLQVYLTEYLRRGKPVETSSHSQPDARESYDQEPPEEVPDMPAEANGEASTEEVDDVPF